MDNWIEVIGKVGFPIAVALYLLWQSRKDKEALEKRFNTLEEFCRNDLKKISEESSQVIKENTEVLNQCKAYLANKGGL